MFGHESVPVVDSQAFHGLPDAQLTAEQGLGHRIAVGVEGDIPFDIDPSFVQLVDFGDILGKRFEMRLLLDVECAGGGPEVSASAIVDDVAPIDELAVQIVQGREGSTGVEVALDIVERPLDARRAIGITNVVGFELEAEALAQRQHRIARYGGWPRAARDDDRRIVDHASRRGSTEIAEGLSQKDPSLESTPSLVDLRIDEPRETQNETGAGQRAPHVADSHGVRGSIVLHLFARGEVISTGSNLRCNSDALTPAESRECGISCFDGCTLRQLLGNPDHVPLTFIVQTPDELEMSAQSRRTFQCGHFLLTTLEDSPNCIAGDPERPCDHPRSVAASRQVEDGCPRIQVEHRSLPFSSRATRSWCKPVSTRRGGLKAQQAGSRAISPESGCRLHNRVGAGRRDDGLSPWMPARP